MTGENLAEIQKAMLSVPPPSTLMMTKESLQDYIFGREIDSLPMCDFHAQCAVT